MTHVVALCVAGARLEPGLEGLDERTQRIGLQQPMLEARQHPLLDRLPSDRSIVIAAAVTVTADPSRSPHSRSGPSTRLWAHGPLP